MAKEIVLKVGSNDELSKESILNFDAVTMIYPVDNDIEKRLEVYFDGTVIKEGDFELSQAVKKLMDTINIEILVIGKGHLTMSNDGGSIHTILDLYGNIEYEGYKPSKLAVEWWELVSKTMQDNAELVMGNKAKDNQ